MGIKERREMEKQWRKDQILDAARKLLLEDGMQTISINGIAREAELGVGTIYFYYKNKEEIFAALQQEGLRLLYSSISAIYRAKKDPKIKLKQMGLAYLSFSSDNKDYFDIINYFLASPKPVFPEKLKKKIDESGNKILDVISSVVSDGIAEKSFRETDSRRFSIMFWGTIHGLVQFQKLETTVLKGDNHREIYQYAVENLIKGLC